MTQAIARLEQRAAVYAERKAHIEALYPLAALQAARAAFGASRDAYEEAVHKVKTSARLVTSVMNVELDDGPTWTAVLEELARVAGPIALPVVLPNPPPLVEEPALKGSRPRGRPVTCNVRGLKEAARDRAAARRVSKAKAWMESALVQAAMARLQARQAQSHTL